jgi:hypothetical protein
VVGLVLGRSASFFPVSCLAGRFSAHCAIWEGGAASQPHVTVTVGNMYLGISVLWNWSSTPQPSRSLTASFPSLAMPCPALSFLPLLPLPFLPSAPPTHSSTLARLLLKIRSLIQIQKENVVCAHAVRMAMRWQPQAHARIILTQQNIPSTRARCQQYANNRIMSCQRPA